MTTIHDLKEDRGIFEGISESSFERAEIKAVIKTLAKAYLSKEIRTCKTSIIETYYELKKINKEKIMEKENIKFQLRRGIVLDDSDSTKIMSQANITNDLALYHINKNRKCLEWFDQIPSEKELEEMLAELQEKATDESTEEKPLEDMKKAELQEKATELGIEFNSKTTVAELIALIKEN